MIDLNDTSTTVLGNAPPDNTPNIPMYRAHKNRLSGNSKKLFMEAWRNQEGICLLSSRLLKKSKCIFGLYETPDKDKFDGMKSIPFLVSEEYIKEGKNEVYKKIDLVFRDLFKYDGISTKVMADVEDLIKPLEGEISIERKSNNLDTSTEGFVSI